MSKSDLFLQRMIIIILDGIYLSKYLLFFLNESALPLYMDIFLEAHNYTTMRSVVVSAQRNWKVDKKHLSIVFLWVGPMAILVKTFSLTKKNLF